MDFLTVFKFLLESFEREKIDFAVIGGFALQFSDITRTTRDIDLLVLSHNAETIKNIMAEKGYRLIHESEDVLNFGSDNIELGRVDFLLAHREYTLAMLVRAESKKVLDGKYELKVLKIEDIIGLKIQSSSNDPERFHQDMADIELLIQNNYPAVNLKLLREYFTLFDRKKELDEIINRCKNAKR